MRTRALKVGLNWPMRSLSVLVATAVVALLLWTARSTGEPARFGGKQTDYYNLLVAGLRKGQLHMDVIPDPRLGPGMPTEPPRAGDFLLDASYYRGKYFLYFGATPALLLFLPWSAIVAEQMPEWFGAGILAAAVYLGALTWLNLLRREFVPQVRDVSWLVAVLALGIGTGIPVVLRPAKFYQIAILSGTAFTMAALVCLTLFVLRKKCAHRWMALASLCVGLAAGSRPTLIPGGLLALVFTAAWHWRNEALSNRRPGSTARLIVAALGPVGGCLAALGWYNWMRYDSPFEFGLHYQLGSNANGFPFTAEAFWRNLRVYYFTPPDVGWVFPFFAPGPKPPGSNPEEMHGMFLFLPLLLLLAAASIASLRRWRELPRGLAVVAAAAGVWAGTTFVVVASSPNHSDRYALDFHPIVAVVALLVAWRCTVSGRRRWRWSGQVACGWLGIVCIHGFFIPFQTHGYFRDANSREFAAHARVWEGLVWPLQRHLAPVTGGLELGVTFSAGEPGRLEPILVAGAGTEVDGILFWPTGSGRARLVFDHQGFGLLESSEFELRPGVPRTLAVQLGSLVPPAWHPWHDGQPAGSIRLASRVSVRLDGVMILAVDSECFPSSANQVVVGRRAGLMIGSPKFSGKLEVRRTLPPDWAWLDTFKRRLGPLKLQAVLPRDRFGHREPMVVSGALGRQDFLIVEYLREGAIRLLAHHEGNPLAESAPIAVDYGRPHEFIVTLKPTGFAVRLDGQRVFAPSFPAYPAEPWEYWAGCTPRKINTTRNLFGGRILSAARSDADYALTLASGRPFVMRIAFPGNRIGSCEPLLTTGATGRGDNLYVRYLDKSHVVFGLDHWGVGATESAPIALNYDDEQVLEISYGALLREGDPGRGRLQLNVNGAVVLEFPPDFYPATSAAARLGENYIGASSSQPAFTGEILSVQVR